MPCKEPLGTRWNKLDCTVLVREFRTGEANSQAKRDPAQEVGRERAQREAVRE